MMSLSFVPHLSIHFFFFFFLTSQHYLDCVRQIAQLHVNIYKTKIYKWASTNPNCSLYHSCVCRLRMECLLAKGSFFLLCCPLVHSCSNVGMCYFSLLSDCLGLVIRNGCSSWKGNSTNEISLFSLLQVIGWYSLLHFHFVLNRFNSTYHIWYLLSVKQLIRTTFKFLSTLTTVFSCIILDLGNSS